jgi:hypothetical protein
MTQNPGRYGWTLGDVDPGLAERTGTLSTLELANPVKPVPQAAESQVVAEVTQTFGLPPAVVWLCLIVGGLVALKALSEGHFWRG